MCRPDPFIFPLNIEAIIDNTYYHYSQTDQVTAPGLKQTAESTIVETAYRATAAPEKTVYKQGETIKITGQAISNASTPGTLDPSTPVLMPNVPVKIGISVRGFDRYYTVNTDENGNFIYNFTPASTEAGTYSVWAVHPDINDRTVQAQFNIVGLQISPTSANIRMAKNTSYDIPVTIKNLGDATLSNLTFDTTASSGITASVINNGDTSLTAGESQNATLRITASSTASDTGYASLTATAIPSPLAGEGQGERLSVKLDANLTLVQALPIINTNPSYIDTGLVRGTQKIQTFTITNSGLDTLKNARLEGPSTSWMSLTVDKNIGDIPADQNKSIGIMIKPGDAVAQGVYNDRITIYSDNHIPYSYNIQVTVTSNAVGNVLFDVLNELMEDVPNATITFQHQTLTELLYNLRTGADGTVSQFDIPEGRYTFNITATGHKPTSGTFTISPGLTTTVPIALELNMVNIERVECRTDNYRGQIRNQDHSDL
jgi:hypothetical protein